MVFSDLSKNRSVTIGIVEFFYISFYAVGIYCLYLMFTLNFQAVIVVLLLCLFQATIGKQSETYINFIKRIMKPSNFFRKYDTIYESSDVPYKKVIFSYSPHGVYAMPFIMNVHNDDGPLSKSIHLGSRFILNSPVHGLLLKWWGIQGVNGQNMNRLMDEQENIALVPGGYEQATITTPKAMRIFIKKRKGFIKMALKKGYSICPVLVMGEHQMYQTVDKFNPIGLFLNKFKMPGVIHYNRFGLLPDPSFDITNIIGKPIVMPTLEKPSQDQLNYWHKQYIEAVVALYEKYKHLNNNLPLEIH